MRLVFLALSLYNSGMEKQCIFCQKVNSHRRSEYCSDSCRCKAYYKAHLKTERLRGKARYQHEKENNYEHLRRVNLKASRRYKEKNTKLLRKKGVEYQRRTKMSLKYHDKRYFDGRRQEIISLYEGLCAMCNAKGQVIHHIDGSGRTESINNDVNNLILMCRGCHAKYHYKGKLIDEDIVRTCRRL